MKTESILGNTYGKLTVIGEGYMKKRRQWECLCECGKIIHVNAYSLKSGNTKSCGCFRSDYVANKNFVHGHARRGHKDKIYNLWTHIKDRCYNPKSEFYHCYGGRGITMDAKWRECFATFKNEVGIPPKDNMWIERINNDGNYEPGNCTWATIKEQGNNRRVNVFIEYKGERKTMAQWSDVTGISTGTIRYRLHAGWRVEDILFKEPHS